MTLFNSVQAKLLGAFLALIAVMVLVGFVGLWTASTVSSQLEEVSGNLVPSLRALAVVSGNFAEMRMRTRQAVSALRAKDPVDLQRSRNLFEQARRRVDTGASALRSLPKAAATRTGWESFEKHYEGAARFIDEVWADIDNGEVDKATATLVPAVVACDEAREDWTSLPQSRTAWRTATASRRPGQGVMPTIAQLVSTLLAVVVALGVGVALTSAITKPLREVTTAATRIARGDMDQAIEHHGTDELGQLADAFRSMLDYLRGVAASADAISCGDFLRRSRRGPRRTPYRTASSDLTGALVALIAETHVLIVAAEEGALDTRGKLTSVSRCLPGSSCTVSTGSLTPCMRPSRTLPRCSTSWRDVT